MTSATERLRALLDERDEYYQTSGNKTWWGRPIDRQTGKPINVFHYQAQPMGEDRLFVELQLATPEQAVAATLGPGTCEVVSSTLHEYEGGYAGSEWEHELSCGDTVWWGNGDAPEWCPWCGRKVMG